MLKIEDIFIENLTTAARTKELIDTNKRQRLLGKTASLIRYAKKHDNIAVVLNEDKSSVASKRVWYDYKNIFSVSELDFAYFDDCVYAVIDEFVDINTVEGYGLTVLTGYKRLDDVNYHMHKVKQIIESNKTNTFLVTNFVDFNKTFKIKSTGESIGEFYKSLVSEIGEISDCFVDVKINGIKTLRFCSDNYYYLLPHSV
ncbi:hypothetical protein [Paenibacillus sp. 1781tsa1]|uniref:hypothetical protein n=1 Tax=Paenibacillus sp. 1781tsa1 TaxID=2953810 RepID=UPI00209D088F|nr:hypothetical protein [Paenibacillus sp. 1781tsa1]MCP1184932.1 hypothetical protein [Paenibacillus sp. 1781tsa1]